MTNSIPANRSPAFRPTHPSVILRDDVLPALRISVKGAADQLGVSRQSLHAILAERRAITPDMAVRLGKLVGNGPRVWLAMQQAHDLWQAERDHADEVARIPTMRAT